MRRHHPEKKTWSRKEQEDIDLYTSPTCRPTYGRTEKEEDREREEKRTGLVACADNLCTISLYYSSTFQFNHSTSQHFRIHKT